MRKVYWTVTFRDGTETWRIERIGPHSRTNTSTSSCKMAFDIVLSHCLTLPYPTVWHCPIPLFLNFSFSRDLNYDNGSDLRPPKSEIYKGKFHPRKSHEDPTGEKTYISILSLNSALDESGWSTPHHGRLTPRKDVYFYSLFKLGARWGWLVNATPRSLDPRERRIFLFSL
jgi:hypothetical protein